jgi:PqqD family protein of HPr-rel-A system
MAPPTCAIPRFATSTEAARKLIWKDWHDGISVYQPSSGETHFFNETTALILKRLERGPASLEDIRAWTAEFLDLEISELPEDGFSSAATRLDELGLVEWLDKTPAHP